jgi:hypothetical protein
LVPHEAQEKCVHTRYQREKRPVLTGTYDSDAQLIPSEIVCVAEFAAKQPFFSSLLGFSHGDFGFVVQALDDAAGKKLLRAEIVEDQLAVLTKCTISAAGPATTYYYAVQATDSNGDSLPHIRYRIGYHVFPALHACQSDNSIAPSGRPARPEGQCWPGAPAHKR